MGQEGALLAGEVRRRIEALAPPGLAESYDNVGWQIGWDGLPVRGILVTLDVDLRVAEEAERVGANLIVAHHPLFFSGLKRIDPTSTRGRLLRHLLCREIGVYAAHTNLDAVRDGVNGALAAALALEAERPLRPVAGAPNGWGAGAVCHVAEPVTTTELVNRVREALESPEVRVAAAEIDGHTRIALLGGSGAEMIRDALAAGCTCYITGEVKYHQAQDAVAAGLTIVEAGHFWSERPVLAALAEELRPLGAPVHVSKVVTSPFAASEEGAGKR
ncbi:MAG TPA: Nif3-like dinuclear metal center hexameric protein [Ardenticatenaceae bacterium]|nr:Nif3-like dinuclear metal center hexameric protein [Ardenticatenaceae bacterium]